MSYELALGDRSYSSWSLRIGLLVARYDLPITCRFARLYTDAFPALLADFPPARTVPALRTPEGLTVTESLAIAEELATRFPDQGLWPADPAARAMARGLASEMHAGFFALREACPMNLRQAYADFPVSPEVQADLDRLETIWSAARAQFGQQGPWLCGAYSIADAFFAPVAARIAGYGLPVGAEAQAYVTAHLEDPYFQAWRAEGLADGPDQETYRRPYTPRPWPVAD
ncbi:MAG: glutathione S-transferase [Mangrovicoccus sp.]|nr:glutathione S-transferase [Mangrovicoccus sp.]